MPKQPKITVQTVVGAIEGEVVAYYAKGRFSPSEFSKAVEAFTGKKVEGKSAHEFWYNVPAEGGDLDVMFRKCNVTDEGAYAVTVVDLEHWDR